MVVVSFCDVYSYLIGQTSSPSESAVLLFAFGMYTICVSISEKLERSANVTPSPKNIITARTYLCCTEKKKSINIKIDIR